MNASTRSPSAAVAFGSAVFSLTGLVAWRACCKGDDAEDGSDLRYPHLLHKDGDIEGMARFFDSLSNAGSFLGLDIGGSLAKMVVFQPDSLGCEGEQDTREASGADAASDAVDQRSSLRRMLRYMKRDATYGRTGRQDCGMRFHSRALRGYFHFIKCAPLLQVASLLMDSLQSSVVIDSSPCSFRSQRMGGAIELATRNKLHHGLVRVCATGGGAIKVCLGGISDCRVHDDALFTSLSRRSYVFSFLRSMVHWCARSLASSWIMWMRWTRW